MHNNFLPTHRAIRYTGLLLLCSTLISGCTNIPATTAWQRDTQAISKPVTPNSSPQFIHATNQQAANQDETSLVIFVYPQSGGVNQGQYFRLPLLDGSPQVIPQQTTESLSN
jgi:hypothetical protein